MSTPGEEESAVADKKASRRRRAGAGGPGPASTPGPGPYPGQPGEGQEDEGPSRSRARDEVGGGGQGRRRLSMEELLRLYGARWLDEFGERQGSERRGGPPRDVFQSLMLGY